MYDTKFAYTIEETMVGEVRQRKERTEVEKKNYDDNKFYFFSQFHRH